VIPTPPLSHGEEPGSIAAMGTILRGAFEPVAAAWAWEPPPRGEPLRLEGRVAARAWLSQVAADQPGALRRLLAERHALPAYGVDDDEVIERLADWVAAGQLRLVPLRRGALSSWGDLDEVEAAAPPPIAAEPEAEEVVAEPATLADDVDAAALAEAMREAAALGVPFCEECTKKKLAAQRSAEARASAGAAA
jgi:hypothetical protein